MLDTDYMNAWNQNDIKRNEFLARLSKQTTKRISKTAPNKCAEAIDCASRAFAPHRAAREAQRKWL